LVIIFLPWPPKWSLQKERIDPLWRLPKAMIHAVDGRIEKYQARFVTRGFSQKEGVDYEKIFAPSARWFDSWVQA